MLLVKRLTRENVKRWADKLNLDLGVGGVLGFRFAQRIFHRIYPVIAKARNLNICADLCRLGGEAVADVCLELVLQRVTFWSSHRILRFGILEGARTPSLLSLC